MRLIGVTVVAVLTFLVANALIAADSSRGPRADVGRIVRVPGAALQVTDTGRRNAPTLVLLHGWAESLHVWDRVMPGLGRAIRVVRVDLIGHGGSAAPVSGYDIPTQAAAVIRVLRALGVRRATVAGHSMGGVIAVEMARLAPQLVRRLVLIDVPTALRYQHPSLLASASLWPLIGPLIHDYAPDFVERDGLSLAVAPGATVPEQMVRDLNRVPWPAYEKSYEDTMDWIAAEPLPARLRAVGIPALVLWGARDQLVAPAAAAEYRLLPRTRVIVIPGVGHTPPVEAPDDVARLLRLEVNGR